MPSTIARQAEQARAFAELKNPVQAEGFGVSLSARQFVAADKERWEFADGRGARVKFSKRSMIFRMVVNQCFDGLEEC